MADKPLKARFYGLYTSGCAETPLRYTGLQSIDVKVGQVLLARTVDAPDKIFVIQIAGQDRNQDKMNVRYAVIGR